jgi:hypothetical protein
MTEERRVRLGEKEGGGGSVGRGGGGGTARWQRVVREEREKGRTEEKIGLQNSARWEAITDGEEMGREETGQEMAVGKPERQRWGLGRGVGKEEG